METSSWHYLFALILAINITKSTSLIGKNVREVKPNEFPFVVSIGKLGTEKIEDRQFCTGTLISPLKVLTAAHCLSHERVHNVEIIIGSASISQGKSYRVREWTTFDMWKYNDAKVEPSLNDIAVITLSRNVDLLNVTPVSIRELRIIPLDSKVKIAGWGVLENGKVPSIMRTAELEIISNDECESVANENFFCSSAVPWIFSSCGDSGAPILNENNQLIGIDIGTCTDKTKLNLQQELTNETKANLHLSLHNFLEFIDRLK